MKNVTPPCVDDAIKLIEDLGHDLASAPEFGFTLSQDDCWDIARAIQAVLLDRSTTQARATELETAGRYLLDNRQVHPDTRMDAVNGPTYSVHGFAFNPLWTAIYQRPK